MSASKKAKLAGLKSLQEAAKMIGRSADLLAQWEKKYPDLFDAVMRGCVSKKSELLVLINDTEQAKRDLEVTESKIN